MVQSGVIHYNCNTDYLIDDIGCHRGRMQSLPRIISPPFFLRGGGDIENLRLRKDIHLKLTRQQIVYALD